MKKKITIFMGLGIIIISSLMPLKVLAIDTDFFNTNDILFYNPDDVACGPSSSDSYETPVKANTIKKFLDAYGQIGFDVGKKYGIPYEALLAQAILESGWGGSGLTQKANNFFGIKAGGSWKGEVINMKTGEVYDGKNVTITAGFRKYPSVQVGWDDYGKFITENPRYKKALNYPNDPIAYIKEVAAAGYATSPSYAKSVIGLINSITKYIKSTGQWAPSSSSTGASSSSTGSITGASGGSDTVTKPDKKYGTGPANAGAGHVWKKSVTTSFGGSTERQPTSFGEGTAELAKNGVFYFAILPKDYGSLKANPNTPKEIVDAVKSGKLKPKGKLIFKLGDKYAIGAWLDVGPGATGGGRWLDLDHDNLDKYFGSPWDKLQWDFVDGGGAATTTGTGCSNGGSGSGDADPGDSSQPANTKKTNKGWSLKDDTDYSATPCASGTTDKGTYKHPTRGFTIRKCQTKSVGIVASIISQRTVNMIAAAKTDGITLAGSGFRTYEHQKQIYDDNGCPCPGRVATPGNSNHERGLAIDFTSGGSSLSTGDKEHKWLDSNGKKYGFINYPAEAWHYSMSGG